jgi:defect-in-organelle-trafficking protein DotA
VGDVLRGASGQLLAQMFSIFNSALLILAGTFTTYAVFNSVVKTAYDGTALGKRMQVGVIFRVLGGTIALAPKFSGGYSLIQVFVMWIVLQGVGFADTAWTAAVTYLQRPDTSPLGIASLPGKTVKGRKVVDSADKAVFMQEVGQAKNILQSAVCMYQLQKEVEQDKANAISQLIKNPQLEKRNKIQYAALKKLSLTLPYYIPVYQGNKVCFGKKESHKLVASCSTAVETQCGAYSWLSGDASDVVYADYKYAGVRKMVNTLLPVAKAIVFPSSITQDNVTQQKQQYIDEILDAVTGYLKIVQPARMRSGENNVVNTDEGWVMAGRYYDLLLTKKMVKADDKFVNFKVVKAPPATAMKAINALDFNLYGALQLTINDLLKVVNPGPSSSRDRDPEVAGVNATITAALKKFDEIRSRTDDDSATVKGHLFTMVGRILDKWKEVVTPNNKIENPIQRLSSLGMTMMTAPVNFWQSASRAVWDKLMEVYAVFTVLLILLGLASGIPGGPSAAANAGGSALLMIQKVIQIKAVWYLPLGMAISVPIFWMGMLMGAYLPFIPLMLFGFAVIGWLISVLEAMVAAPLIALGMTYPEGHDLLGRSEQSIMLLLSVFLRPAAIIIGLLSGVILSFIALYLLDLGFFALFPALLDGMKLSGDLQLVAMVGLLIVYINAVLVIVTQCFSLIHVIPDKIVRWIGGHPDHSSDMSMLDEIQGAVRTMSDAAAGGASKMSGGMKERGVSASKQRIKLPGQYSLSERKAMEKAERMGLDMKTGQFTREEKDAKTGEMKEVTYQAKFGWRSMLSGEEYQRVDGLGASLNVYKDIQTQPEKKDDADEGK